MSIIDVATVRRPAARRTVGFDRFDEPGQRTKLENEGVRIFGPGATVAQDLEPEYIAIGGNKAYVTLQENNAIAIVDIAGATVERIVGLGLKDHSLPGNALDAQRQRRRINIRNWPVFGMYQPDAIASFRDDGATYLVMANEGDAREYLGAGFVEAPGRHNATPRSIPPCSPTPPTLKTNAAARPPQHLQSVRRHRRRR